MKTFFASLAFISFTASLSYGQAGKSSLASNSDFPQSLAKLIRYPSSAQREEKVAKAYVGFNVDAQGEITGVAVLNKGNVDPYFRQEVSRAMKLLPAQKPIYAGNYVLPIVFYLEDTGKALKFREEDAAFFQSLKKDSFLNELHVTGYTANR
ncbi:TonB family protein [Spirosoma sp. KUDC1026]|uniref:TonB family protein n=1 Tax=Spirosoma sp. KUDC1026 TaxID=2745947 RepID=UPI00159BD1B0|nr:TonB family protein [Spirosoma sp. KUDC1026]QKZ12793.1 TonB family protein [Spirosoma sp. KUDC1026]